MNTTALRHVVVHELLAIKLDRRNNIVCSCACTQERERVQESDQQRREEGDGKGERS